MTRTRLDTHLHNITAAINQIGTLVESELEQAIQAMKSGDLALCNLLIAADARIDDIRSEVEVLTFSSFTLQQPLVGRDLRFLSSTPSITTDLERIGDNAAGIAKLLIRMAPLRSEEPVPDSAEPEVHSSPSSITESSIIAEILDLAQEARRVLQATMRAFETSDALAARSIWQEDDVVDVRYHMVRHDLMTMMKATNAIPAIRKDERIMQRMTYWLWIAHNLERIGDHCTNICERTVFFLEGDTAIEPTEEA